MNKKIHIRKYSAMNIKLTKKEKIALIAMLAFIVGYGWHQWVYGTNEPSYLSQTLMEHNPSKYGYLNGVHDGKLDAMDSSPVCGGYNSTVEANACYDAYHLGFLKGCKGVDTSHDDPNPEYPNCDFKGSDVIIGNDNITYLD